LHETKKSLGLQGDHGEEAILILFPNYHYHKTGETSILKRYLIDKGNLFKKKSSIWQCCRKKV